MLRRRSSSKLSRQVGRSLPCRRPLNRRRRPSKPGMKMVMGAVRIKWRMDMKNLRLYMQNRNIIEANQKLREQALLLRQENQDLLFQLQKLFSQPLN